MGKSYFIGGKSIRAAALIAFLLLGAGIEASSPHQSQGAESPARERYIVVLKDSVDHPAALAKQQAAARDASLNHIYTSVINGYAAAMTPAQAAALEGNPKVKYIEESLPMELFAQTLPTGIARSYAAQRAAADIDEQDDVRVDADVAVIDTGVEPSHPDLNVYAKSNPAATYAWVNCLEANPLDQNPENDDCKEELGKDGHGHGTHVAGTVGAIDNEIGAVGVAPGARIWSAKIFNETGGGNSDEAVLAAFNWVFEHASEIDAVNMSFGREGESQVLKEAIANAVDKGVVFVAAAGNFSTDASKYLPAKFSDVITVSALSDYDGKPGGLSSQNCEVEDRGPDDNLARYSNWGSVVDVAAPGTCIYSTLPTVGSVFGKNYGKLSGTSMATPHVTGTAALLSTESNPTSRSGVEAVRQKIIEEGSLNWTDDSGDGKEEPLLDLRVATTEAGTKPATPVPNGVRLNGYVNPGGLASTYRFEYGLTTEYGSSVPISPESVGSGIQDVPVSRGVALKPDTPYHYRVAVTNSGGTVYGADRIAESSRWTIQSTPEPSGTPKASELQSVSCSAPNACTAVGLYKPSAGVLVTFAERWDGQKWTVQSTRNPAGATESRFTRVSCPSASFCMAVGRYKTTGFEQPFAARWNGTEWSLTTTPVPTPPGGSLIKPNGVLNGVSCTSSSHCVAAGHYVSKGIPPKETIPTEERTLVQVWNGSQWAIQSSADKEGQAASRLTSVSCSSATDCMAVGDAASEVGFETPTTSLAERWNGSTWSVQSTPDVVASTRDRLEDVSCVSATACMAVGNAYTNAGTLPGLAMSWNGTEWKLSSSGLTLPLFGISCSSVSSCDAVGAAAGPIGGKHWNGVGWSQANPTVPPLASQVYVRGISCPAKSRCTAVGTYSAGSGPVPLAERSAPAFVHDLSFGDESYSPHSVAADAEGNIWVSEAWRVSKYNSKGELLLRFGNQEQVGSPGGIALTSSGDVLVVNSSQNRVAKFNSKGEFKSQFGSAGSGNGQFNNPTGIAVDASGNIWIADSGNDRVQKFNSSGVFVSLFKGGSGNGPELQWPYGIAVDTTGNLRVVDRGAAAILQYSAAGTYIGKFGTPGSGEGQLEDPKAIAVRASGNLLVGDGDLNVNRGQVQEYTPTGEYIGQFGAGESVGPNSIAIGPGGAIWTIDSSPLEQFGKWYALAAPTVSGQKTMGLAETQTELKASVDPMGSSTTYWFEYGKSVNYGTSVPISPESIGSGFGNVVVGQQVSGLTPGTLYHFRTVAANADGLTYGEDKVFTTGGSHVPLVEAEKYPATVSAGQDVQHSMTFASGSLKCTSVLLGASVSNSTDEVSVESTASGCKAFGVKATVTMNSCRYVFHVLNAGPPYVGTMDVSCSKGGDEIVISTEGCKVKIPPQAGLTGVSFTNVGEESQRGISTALNISGLKYVEGEKEGCASPGQHLNGAFTGTSVLKALDKDGKAEGLYVAGLKT